MKQSGLDAFTRQFHTLFIRAVDLVRNDRSKILLTIALPLGVGYVIAAVIDTEDVGSLYETTRTVLFTIVSAAIYVGMFNSLTLVSKERAIVKREYMTNMSLPAYIGSNMVLQGIISFVQAVLFMVPLWGFPGIYTEKNLAFTPSFWQFTFTLFLVMYASDMMGMLISSIVKRNEQANMAAPIVLIVQLVMSGVLFDMEGGLKGVISSLTVSKWGMRAFANVTHLRHLDTRIEDSDAYTLVRENAKDLLSQFTSSKSTYGMSAQNRLHAWLVLGAMILICAVLCVLALRRVEKDSR